jgi:hypothetical protein
MLIGTSKSRDFRQFSVEILILPNGQLVRNYTEHPVRFRRSSRVHTKEQRPIALAGRTGENELGIDRHGG